MSDETQFQREQEELKAFRKGNINFEFLQPEGFQEPDLEDRAPNVGAAERRTGGRRDGKRGMFNRGRKIVAITRAQMLSWFFVMTGSVGVIVWIFARAESVIWLLGMPFLFLAFLWSTIMLALFRARPR